MPSACFEWQNRCHGRHAVLGNVRVRLRRVERPVLPERTETEGHVALLCGQVQLGRGQLHVPPAAGREDLDHLARGHTGRVPHHPEGPPADHALAPAGRRRRGRGELPRPGEEDRKSTRLNSSHVRISYAVFCLKKKKTSSHPLHTETKTINKYAS